VIYAVFSSRIHVEDTTFKDNKAHDAAVAFIFVSSTFVAERSRFEGNDARNVSVIRPASPAHLASRAVRTSSQKTASTDCAGRRAEHLNDTLTTP